MKPIFFESPQEFYDWLEEHHESEDEVYVGYWKKATGKPSLSWSEAVDQALCFGWIDGRLNRIDDERHMQRFTPRRKGSNWSKVNVEKVAMLEAEGLMQPAGRKAFEAGRPADYSFEQERSETLPERYDLQLRANRQAVDHFESRPPWYRRAAVHWVTSAKQPGTRERRLATLIECSEWGEDVPPLRRR